MYWHTYATASSALLPCGMTLDTVKRNSTWHTVVLSTCIGIACCYTQYRLVYIPRVIRYWCACRHHTCLPSSYLPAVVICLPSSYLSAVIIPACRRHTCLPSSYLPAVVIPGRVLSLSDCKYSLSPLSQTQID